MCVFTLNSPYSILESLLFVKANAIDAQGNRTWEDGPFPYELLVLGVFGGCYVESQGILVVRCLWISNWKKTFPFCPTSVGSPTPVSNTTSATASATPLPKCLCCALWRQPRRCHRRLCPSPPRLVAPVRSLRRRSAFP